MRVYICAFLSPKLENPTRQEPLRLIAWLPRLTIRPATSTCQVSIAWCLVVWPRLPSMSGSLIAWTAFWRAPEGSQPSRPPTHLDGVKGQVLSGCPAEPLGRRVLVQIRAAPRVAAVKALGLTCRATAAGYAMSNHEGEGAREYRRGSGRESRGSPGRQLQGIPPRLVSIARLWQPRP